MEKNWTPFNAFVLLTCSCTFIGYMAYFYFMRHWIHESNSESQQHIRFWIANELLHSDLKTLCLRYVGSTIESITLDLNQQHKLHALLLSHFKDSNRFFHFGLIKSSLLYRASVEDDSQFDPDLFYKSCSGHRNVLIVMNTRYDEIIGGFMSIGIHRFPKRNLTSLLSLLGGTKRTYLEDPSAFLFRLRSPKIFGLKNEKKAIQLSRNRNHIFGFGESALYVEFKHKNRFKKHMFRGFALRGFAHTGQRECIYDFDGKQFFRNNNGELQLCNQDTSMCLIDTLEIHQIEVK
eukprot:2693_1